MPQEKIYGSGERIGPFKVVRLLGSGALGTVYEARPHPEECEELVMLGVRRVAVKVARLDALARTAEQRRRMVERLEREYQTLLKLGNPGCPYLPYVYEMGWHDRTPFLVMELVDGPTLEDVLALQPPMQSMLEIFQKLCAAVAVLHGRGVVHRDIKPSNVLIREEPLLIDFSHCLLPTGHRITGANELVGTPLYASPQADGYALFPESEQPYLATAQDDVWSLGVVLYRMLTGDAPWRSPPQHREALVREMLQGPPRHPSEVNPQVPRTLGDVALKLLQPEPALRLRDAIAVLEALEPVVRASVVEGQVPTARPRAIPPGASFPPALPAAAKARPARGRGRRVLAVAATVLLALGLDLAGRMGLEGARRVVGRATQTVAAPGGAKASLPSALPVPPEPLPGQMRAPCPKQYVEESGGCWDELSPGMTPEGKPKSSCPDNDLLREKREKNGRLRCLLAVMRPTPSAEEPGKGKH